MKHVIEVPAGHTVQISRRGNRVTVESAESRDQLSPVGGSKLVGVPASTEEVINVEADTQKVHEPGTVLVWAYRKPYTENEKLREFIVYGSEGKIACTLGSEKVLKINPDGYHSDCFDYYDEDDVTVITVPDARYTGICEACAIFIGDDGESWNAYDRGSFLEELDQYSDKDLVLIVNCHE